jgi:xylulose-5-phosphate/fructose-6-phosphate phosphoketolase
VAQVHLCSNPLVASIVDGSEVKPHPNGHWGTVPGTAWMLAHLGVASGRLPDVEIIPVLGSGHAGVVQRALAWLTGDLAKVNPRFSRDAVGLAAMVASFPDDALGSEVHPALPAGAYVGGWLGGALAFAQGIALDTPDRVSVPIIGDGECETPATAASWLAQQALPGARVLPVVHANGHRMGGPSLMGVLTTSRSVRTPAGWDGNRL